jgi:hypothetical protein
MRLPGGPDPPGGYRGDGWGVVCRAPVPFSCGSWDARRRSREVKRSGTSRELRATAQIQRSLPGPSRFVGSDQSPPVARPPGGGDACPGGLAVIDAPWGVRAGPVPVFRAPVQGSAEITVARMLKRGKDMIDQRQWYAGVDWASESHHVFLTDGDGRTIGEKAFKHGGEGLAEMAAWLMAISGAVVGSQIQSRSRCRTAPWSKC